MSDFKTQVPCFNATVPEFELPSASNDTDTNADSDAARASAPADSEPASGSKGLSGGAIAGIVIGVVGGITLLAGAAFFIWRLRNQRERLRAQEASVRAVKWDQTERSSATPSDNDVALRDLPAQKP